MSRPWMPLYVADYLGDTGHLSAAEHGAYMLLIMHYWMKGGLPHDEQQIQRITRMSGEEWSRSRDTLRALFGDNWSHGRVDEELAKSDALSSKRSASAKRRWSNSNANALQEDMQTACTRDVVVNVLNEGEEKVEDSEALPRARAPRQTPAYPDEFLILWESFPRHPNASKHEACKAWQRLPPDDRDACLDGAMAYGRFLASERAKRPEYPALHLATFINQRRFESLLEAERAAACVN